MAKATATCTCKICGNTFTKAATKPNRREADSWVEWAQEHFDVCNSCYAKQVAEKEKAEGLIAKVRLGSPYEDKMHIFFVLFGDTYPLKEDLKAIGGRYTDDYPTEDSTLTNTVFHGLSTKPPMKRWAIHCLYENGKEVAQKLAGLGFKLEFPSKETQGMWLRVHAESAAHKDARQAEEAKAAAEKGAEKQKKLDELGPIPAWPEDILSIWPAGARWNGKFYGRPGRYSVYLGGEKVDLSDTQKDEMEKTSEARAAWRKRKEEIGQGR